MCLEIIQSFNINDRWISPTDQKKTKNIRIPSTDEYPSFKQNLMHNCCECNGYTIYKFTQWFLTADWVTSRESVDLRMHSRFLSEWLHHCRAASSPDIYSKWLNTFQAYFVFFQSWLAMSKVFLRELMTLICLFLFRLRISLIWPWWLTNVFKNCILKYLVSI